MRLSNENQCLIVAKLLVDAGLSPCALDADDKPPILTAVARGFVSVVEYLISQNAPLPSRVLFAASQATVVRRVEMIRLLTSKGANIHVLKPNGDSILHTTMRSPDRSVCLEIAAILIDVGCDPTARNLDGETPLHIVAKQGYHEIVNYLLLFSSPFDISSLLQGDPAVQVTALRSLIGTGAADTLPFSPEQEARVTQVVRQFLDVEDKCLEWAKLFVAVSSHVFARSSGSAMLFDVAVRRGFSEVVEYLNSQASSIPPAVLFTALRYQVSMIPSLISKGANVHVQEDNGDTLLHVAMSTLKEFRCWETTQILVEAGCNPVALNIAGVHPIHTAVSRGLWSVVKYLLSQATLPLPSDILFFALESRRFYHGQLITIVSSLIRKGANVHARALDQSTLLHRVLQMESEPEGHCVELIKLLIDAGCNASLCNVHGKLPIQLAVHRALPSVVDYLLSQNTRFPPGILLDVLNSPNASSSEVLRMTSSFITHGASAGVASTATYLQRFAPATSTVESVGWSISSFFQFPSSSTSARQTEPDNSGS